MIFHGPPASLTDRSGKGVWPRSTRAPATNYGKQKGPAPSGTGLGRQGRDHAARRSLTDRSGTGCGRTRSRPPLPIHSSAPAAFNRAPGPICISATTLNLRGRNAGSFPEPDRGSCFGHGAHRAQDFQDFVWNKHGLDCSSTVGQRFTFSPTNSFQRGVLTPRGRAMQLSAGHWRRCADSRHRAGKGRDGRYPVT